MKAILVTCLAMLAVLLQAQESRDIYHPMADARSDIAASLEKARNENKHILIQVGGNWCPWCIKLHDFFATDARIDSILQKDYIYMLVNYSKENKNESLMAEFGYPQRFGFPVLLVMDPQGKILHTQDTALLELDKSYDPFKVSRFLLGWNPAALAPR